MKAYKAVTYIEHRDGTPDTEVVDLLCEECTRQRIWAELGGEEVNPVSDADARIVQDELCDREYEGETLAALQHQAIDYMQSSGEVCEHLL